jgi:hypothetical protein
MTKNKDEELDGTTLSVYLCVLRKGKPVGPRDVVKVLNLSSPSVAYRHLQKLENMDYLQKNEYGEYTAKNKAHVSGYVWIGHRLTPKNWVYSIVFAAIFLWEIIVFAIHYQYETYQFKIFYVLLLIITGFALSLFTLEGFVQNRRKFGNRTE